MKNFYEVISYYNGGYDEDIEETFETFEEAETYCRMHDKSECYDEEGMFIRCHEDGAVWEEDWD